jgi:hypothetical protein
MRVKRKPLKLKGINRVPMRLADGSIKFYFYHRATGIKLDPDNLAESYAAAEKKQRTRNDDTLTSLIRHFDTSAYYDGLSEEHRKQYVWKFKRIEVKWGWVPVATFNDADDALEFRRDALAWHNELGKKSARSADNLMAALAVVLSYAKQKVVIKFNPIDTFERLYKSHRADKTWSEELQQAFLKNARPAMATAMYLVRNTAMRAHDIRKFDWTKYDGERVQVRSRKTGKSLWIPATRELKAHLDGLDRRGSLVLLTVTDRAYQRRYFNEHWREDADAIGAGDLNFHDNRGTAATLLAEAGATALEIAEALAWTVERAQKTIEVYLARRGTLAAHAIAKLEDYRDRKAAADAVKP